MTADPSAMYCQDKYGNIEPVETDRFGTFYVTRLPDGELHECWTVYRREVLETRGNDSN